MIPPPDRGQPPAALTGEDSATHIAALSRLVNAQARRIADLESSYPGRQRIDQVRIEALQAEVQSLRRGLLAALDYLGKMMRSRRGIVALSKSWTDEIASSKDTR